MQRYRVLYDGYVPRILEYSARPGGVDRGWQRLLSLAPQPLGLLTVDTNEIGELAYLARGPQQSPGTGNSWTSWPNGSHG